MSRKRAKPGQKTRIHDGDAVVIDAFELCFKAYVPAGEYDRRRREIEDDVRGAERSPEVEGHFFERSASAMARSTGRLPAFLRIRGDQTEGSPPLPFGARLEFAFGATTTSRAAVERVFFGLDHERHEWPIA